MTDSPEKSRVSPVDLTIDDEIAVITMTAGASRNALSPALLAGLNQALDKIETSADEPDDLVRCVVLTGTGDGFCAGADLSAGDGADLLDDDGQLDLGIGLDRTYHPLLLRLRDLHCPFVTAVNGVAAGGGMSLALMGDIVLAAESATFLQAFRHIGLSPDMGATFLLPRLVGFGRAMELSLLGERLDAATALDWGLVNRVTTDDELMERTMEIASTLATGPTVALRRTREAMWHSVESTYEQQLAVERENQRALGNTSDFVAGVRGFLKKEPARFEGR
ncbi:MAG: enoyl-CoA hydratase-related protein [Acidimicrobiia bacterium]|nr:enoyl-CoA hydratase-related protein [Acidimicrobiia bacterium]